MNPILRLQRLCRDEPELVLFEQQDRRLDAQTLYRRSATLAAQLRKRGVGRGSNVALSLSRGLHAVVAVYGVLLAGGCYVPLNPSCSSARNHAIMRDAGCGLLLVAGTDPVGMVDDDIDALDIGKLPEDAGADFTPPLWDDDERAAILYTSGSSGQPKGVVIPLCAITAFSDWCVSSFGLNSSDRVASLAPFNFDLALFDLFAATAAGATSCFVPDPLKMAPSRLVDWLQQQQISSWYTVPSMLGLMALKGGLAGKTLPLLRQILFAGEVFPTERLRQLTELLPDTAFFNLFGPTETNVCLYWPVDRQRLRTDQPIPIGIPAAGALLRIDPDSGELLVKGPCLMSGYWRGGATESVLDADGWLHSGDRVSVSASGEYHYHGRLDRMIKSAGYRIEPAEVERLLCAAPGVRQAVVLGVPDPLSGTRIVAAVVSEQADRAALRAFVGARLAAWMRPSFFLLLDALPLLPNGKTDYQRITNAIEQALSP